MRNLFTTAILLLGLAAPALAQEEDETTEPVVVEVNPVTFQYMVKPGVYLGADETIFNITECELYPDHSPKTEGWTVALSVTTPPCNLEVNQDPGIPVGNYKTGKNYDSTGNYFPYYISSYSEAYQMVSTPSGYHRVTYELHEGTLNLYEEDGKYYVEGELRGGNETYYDVDGIKVTIPKTEITPEYSIFAYPEADPVNLVNPGLLGHYTARHYLTNYWGEYSLQFYTCPLDATYTAEGAGEIMTLVINTEYVDPDNGGELDPESLAGDYGYMPFVSSLFYPFSIRGGYVNPITLVFGEPGCSRIDIINDEGYREKSSYCADASGKIEYLGDLRHRIEMEMVSQFGVKHTLSWEGNLFEIVTGMPKPAGVEGITDDTAAAKAEYFDLSGTRVSGTPAQGIYIVRRGAKVSKEIIK